MMVADPQVSLDGVFQEQAVLHRQGLIEAQRVAHRFQILGRRVGGHQQLDGIPGDMEHHKDNQGDHKKDDQGLIEPSEKVYRHCRFADPGIIRKF